MPGRRVVITGMAALTSLGRELGPFWRDLCAGRSGISNIERFDATRFKTRFAGEIKNFDPQPYIDPREQKRLDRFAQYAMVASAMAVEDSGLDFSAEDPYRCGVILGSGIGGVDLIEDAHEKLQRDPSRLSPLMIPRMIINSASGHVSIQHGLRGPNSAVAAACASGSYAIGDAFKAVQRGDAEVMITGGAEGSIVPLCIGGFCAMRALSQRNDCPERASRPFDRDRDGFVLSEGAGLIVLEEFEHARRRGARIYAEMLGFGSTSDGLHITAPDPEGRGASNAMKLALRDAGIGPEAVGYVNAHGTGTPLGDRAETVALKLVFGSYAHRLMISSTKSHVGHLLGASGGVEFIVTIMALYHGVVPPTINLDNPDPECDLDYVPHQAREHAITYGMSNSFGFGGHNASLVVGALEEQACRSRMAA